MPFPYYFPFSSGAFSAVGLIEDFTTTSLLASLKRRGMLPSSADTLSTSDFLALATEEMRAYCLPLLVSVDEEYGVATYDVSVTSGTASYLIPPRASGDAARVVEFAQSGGTFHPLSRCSPVDAGEYGTSGGVQAFYFADDYVTLVPSPSAAGTLRIKYIRRPNALVATSAVAAVAAINTSTRTITLASSVPANFTTTVQYDFIRSKPGFPTLAIDMAASSVSALSMTFTTALPSDLAVGDYVSLAGESAVPQLPVEMHPLLAQRTKFACLEALGDPKASAALATCERMKKEILPLLTPRAKGNSRPIVNRFGPGWGR